MESPRTRLPERPPMPAWVSDAATLIDTRSLPQLWRIFEATLSNFRALPPLTGSTPGTSTEPSHPVTRARGQSRANQPTTTVKPHVGTPSHRPRNHRVDDPAPIPTPTRPSDLSDTRPVTPWVASEIRLRLIRPKSTEAIDRPNQSPESGPPISRPNHAADAWSRTSAASP